MKRVGFWFTIGIFALVWLRAFHYGLIEGHYISFVLCLIVLGPVTIRVVHGFLLSKSAEKEEQNMASASSQLEWQAPEQPAAGTARFCPSCGARNENGGDFCPSCGERM